MNNSTRCNQCAALIIWRYNNTSGRPAPLDAEPWSTGNIMLHDDGRTYQVLSPELVEQARERGVNLYTNHFGTCPGREASRKESLNEQHYRPGGTKERPASGVRG